MEINLSGKDIVQIIREAGKQKALKLELGEFKVYFSAQSLEMDQKTNVPILNIENLVNDEPVVDPEDQMSFEEFQQVLEDPTGWEDRQINPEKQQDDEG